MAELNSFRLSVRTVGFKDRRDQYLMHVNCACNLKKSLIGQYQSQAEMLAAIPAWCTGSLAPRQCPKSEPIRVVETQKKKTRKMHAKTRFLNEILELIVHPSGDGPTGLHVSTGHTAQILRENGKCVQLMVQNPDGNFFEFRCEFTAANAKKAILQIWELMLTMGL